MILTMPLNGLKYGWWYIYIGFRLYTASELRIYGDLMEFKGAYWDLIHQEC